jgi:hypothetical protein
MNQSAVEGTLRVEKDGHFMLVTGLLGIPSAIDVREVVDGGSIAWWANPVSAVVDAWPPRAVSSTAGVLG